MALFANPGTATIRKCIQGVTYVCPPGELVEIPDRYAYVIATEGVALVKAEEATATEPTVAQAKSAVVEIREPQSSYRPHQRRKS